MKKENKKHKLIKAWDDNEFTRTCTRCFKSIDITSNEFVNCHPSQENKKCCEKCVVKLPYFAGGCNKIDCPCHQEPKEETKSEGWEDELLNIYGATMEQVKFIRSLLAQQKTELIKQILDDTSSTNEDVWTGSEIREYLFNLLKE